MPGIADQATVPVCGSADLGVALHWEPDGSGLRGQVVAENVGNRACRLPGKPTVAPLGLDGEPLPAKTVVTLEMMEPGYVVLAPGGRAAARARWPNWCGRQASDRALVSWGGGSVIARVHGSVQPACDPGRPGDLTSSWSGLIECAGAVAPWPPSRPRSVRRRTHLEDVIGDAIT